MMAALAGSGLYVGESLVEPELDAAPLYEDARVLAAHDELLAAFGLDWRSAAPLPDGWQTSEAVAPIRDRLAGYVDDDFAHHPHFAVKDPRLSLLAPLWLELCRDRAIAPQFIVMFRHPTEVASSLAVRDGLPTEAAELLWIYHCLYAEHHSRGYPRAVVSYQGLIDRSPGMVRALSTRLCIELATATPVDPSQRHHVERAEPKTRWLAEVYRLLLRSEGLEEAPGEGDARPRHDAVCAGFDGARGRFDEALALFTPYARRQSARLVEVEAGMDQATSVIEEQRSQMARLSVGFEQAMETVDAQKRQFADQQSGFEGAVKIIKERDATIAEMDAQLAEREQDLVARTAELREAQADLAKAANSSADMQAELEALRQRLRTADETANEHAARYRQARSDLDDLIRARRAARGVAEQADTGSPLDGSGSPHDASASGREPKLRYESVIDLRVVNNAHSKIYRCIEETSLDGPRRVLDVGCSSGYLGRELRKLGHEVWGVEISHGAAEQAAEDLDQVYCGSIESFFEQPEHREVRFDYIVFADVLEHVMDPEGVLDRCRDFLAPDGSIIVSLPNVAHLAVRLMLLEGRWEYHETGILDRTHLRFFARDSIADMFTECGYEMHSMDAVRLPIGDLDIGVDDRMLVEVVPYLSDSELDVFQYVVRVARPREATDPGAANSRFKLGRSHRILCLPPAPESTLVDIRLKAPLTKLTQLHGGEVRTASIHDYTAEDRDWCEVVVFQREASAHVLGVMTEFRRLGRKVIFEIDDLLTEVPKYLTVHEHCKQMRPFLEDALRMADVVTVSTERLRDELTAYNEHVVVVPNCSTPQYPPINHYEVMEKGVAVATLLVASSDTVRVDFIADTLRRLLEEDDLQVRLVGIGPPGRFLKEEGLEIEVHPMMEHERFRAFLADQENTIGIIPLDDSVFNRCKSAVKYLDYSFAGIPCICSDMPPYADVITHGENGYLCGEDEDIWYETIRELTVSAMLRRKIARAALETCQREHGIYRGAVAWQRALEECGSVRAEDEGDASYETRWLPSTRSLASHVLRPRSYVYAYRILRLHGVRGVVRRLRSLV